LDAGSKPVSLSYIDLESIVLQVFEILKPLADAAGIQLILRDEAPGVLMGDSPLISGAVLNLVSNAIKYGQPGSPINVRCFRNNEEVIISVQNVGKPIAEQDVARLFDPYYRASNVEKTKTGWGLGLAFVKRIAEKHGGSVRAESLIDGAQFEIHLPANTEPVVVAKEKS
jgi:signal transduction histidine kinase